MVLRNLNYYRSNQNCLCEVGAKIKNINNPLWLFCGVGTTVRSAPSSFPKGHILSNFLMYDSPLVTMPPPGIEGGGHCIIAKK